MLLIAMGVLKRMVVCMVFSPVGVFSVGAYSLSRQGRSCLHV